MNPPTMFQQYIKKLVRSKEYFNIPKNVSMCKTRIIGINEHGFQIDDGIVDWRENIHCFSEEYEKLNKHHLMSSETFFHKIKDTLPDLMWVVVGYY
jgi:hypothetical protein